MHRLLTAALVAMPVLAGCGPGAPAAPDNAAVAAAVAAHRPAEVTAQGRVAGILADSHGPKGTHQRFGIDLGGALTVEVDHNVELAPRVPLSVGSWVIVHGQFEPDPGHPVIHYTHHATGRHEGGWIELAGRRFDRYDGPR